MEVVKPKVGPIWDIGLKLSDQEQPNVHKMLLSSWALGEIWWELGLK